MVVCRGSMTQSALESNVEYAGGDIGIMCHQANTPTQAEGILSRTGLRRLLPSVMSNYPKGVASPCDSRLFTEMTERELRE